MVILYAMKLPIYVRPLSYAEHETLEAGLCSPDTFTLRRCQILLASDGGQNAYQIAHNLGCNPQTARNAIHGFNEKDFLRRSEGTPITRTPFIGLSTGRGKVLIAKRGGKQ
jgi:predicted ArsR family transcriptional regulator